MEITSTSIEFESVICVWCLAIAMTTSKARIYRIYIPALTERLPVVDRGGGGGSRAAGVATDAELGARAAGGIVVPAETLLSRETGVLTPTWQTESNVELWCRLSNIITFESASRWGIQPNIPSEKKMS